VNTARVLAVSFLARPRGSSPVFLRIHRDIPANIRHAAQFGAIACGAPQVSSIGMWSVHPINPAKPVATADIAAMEA
jgi:hypothetical protein